MRMLYYVLLGTVLTFVPSVRGQDIASGPTKGEIPPALQVFDVTGSNKDKEVDYPAERKDKPTIYLLLQADKFDRPMNRFMKTLDSEIKKGFADTYVVAVWLTEELDKTKDFLPRVQQSVNYETTALTCFNGKAGPNGWGVNVDAHLTAVVVNKEKVAANFGYNSLNETDVPKVIEALKKAREEK